MKWTMFSRVRTGTGSFKPRAARLLPPAMRRVLAGALYFLGGPWLWQDPSYQRWNRRRYAARAVTPGVKLIDDSELERELTRLTFENVSMPVLSILIATFGNLRQVVGCLRSIAAHPPSVPYEVIVVDDASQKPEMAVLAMVPGLHYASNTQNLGYLRSVNAGSRLAKGEYLWLLNDDTIVTGGAADALLDAVGKNHPRTIAGSRLLNLDGTVQEAGSTVWRDGTATNIGSGSDYGDATTRYTHEVDYCSGASLMLRTTDFTSSGGFDEQFAPAYYEDTDLAFTVRKRGGRVFFVPSSVVFHLGGASYGRAASRHLLAENRRRFTEKWRTVLETEHFRPGSRTFLARDRAAHRQVVLLLAKPGTSDQLPAQVEALLIDLKNQDVAVKLWLDGVVEEGLIDRLGGRGIELVSANRDVHLDRWLMQHGRALGLVIVSSEVSRPVFQSLERHFAGPVLQLGRGQMQLPSLDYLPFGSPSDRPDAVH